MPGTLLGYPFDEEIFVAAWGNQPDFTRAALLKSGALIDSPLITGALAGGGNYFTVPFYKPLTGDPAIYDGKTDIPVKETEGGSQSGVAYGRTQAWKERDFVPDFIGNDPMGHIVRNVSNFWDNQRQKTLLGVISGVLGATGMEQHTNTITKPSDLGQLPGSINKALAEIHGAEKQQIKVLITDSLVATELENLNLLHYRKGVQPDAALRSPRIGDFLGYTLIVDDTAMGYYETVTMKFTAGASAAGDITITLNGVAKKVAVESTDTTGAKVAAAVAAVDFPGWDVSVKTDTVTFKSQVFGDLTDATFADAAGADATSVAATVQTTVQGVEQIYALGYGALLTGQPRLGRSAELERQALKNGGETYLATKIRDVIHPNGFTYAPAAGIPTSPTDAELKTSASYTLEYPHKGIYISKIVLKNA